MECKENFKPAILQIFLRKTTPAPGHNFGNDWRSGVHGKYRFVSFGKLPPGHLKWGGQHRNHQLCANGQFFATTHEYIADGLLNSTIMFVIGPVSPDDLSGGRGRGWEEDSGAADDSAAAVAPKRHPNIELQLCLKNKVTVHSQIRLKWTPCDFGRVSEAGCCRVVDAAQRSALRSSLDEAAPWIEAGYGFSQPVEEKLHALGIVGVSFHHGDFSSCGQELLQYNEGGHFTWHRDRVVDEEEHVGTLLLVIPSPDMEGGVLKVASSEDGSDSVDIVCPESAHTTSTAFMVYLPLDVWHTVTPVTKGTRFVAKAPVLGTKEDLSKPRARRMGLSD